MIIDKGLVFSNCQAVAANTYSTDALETPARSAGGDDLDMYLTVIAHSETGTTPTLSATLQTSSDGATYVDVVGLKKPSGKKMFSCKLDGLRLRKYVRISYIVGGTTPAYSVSAYLSIGEQQANDPLPDSPRIS